MLALVAGCAANTPSSVYTDDEVSVPTTAALVVPLTTTTLPPGDPASTTSVAIVFDQLSSPGNAVAEIVGTGATPGDSVTVDGEPAAFTSFRSTAAGGFVAEVFIATEGAHTVCIATTCGRVYTLDPDAESLDDVAAKIEDAKVAATARFDFTSTFPDWTIATAGPFSGVGGTTDTASKTVTIYSNRNRTVAEFERTILHEWGHVLDAERLTDDERATYLVLRGIATDRPWTSDGDHSIEAWAEQPSEDFAEIMAMLLSAGEYLPRTETLGPPPPPDQLGAIGALVDLD